jgi:hypothetical protein
MSLASPIVLDGTLKPDGSLVFDMPPQLPSGRVRVTLQPMVAVQPTRLPDPPWADQAIPAPFDLPNPTIREPIRPRWVSERLPEPWVLTEHGGE